MIESMIKMVSLNREREVRQGEREGFDAENKIGIHQTTTSVRVVCVSLSSTHYLRWERVAKQSKECWVGSGGC